MELVAEIGFAVLPALAAATAIGIMVGTPVAITGAGVGELVGGAADMQSQFVATTAGSSWQRPGSIIPALPAASNSSHVGRVISTGLKVTPSRLPITRSSPQMLQGAKSPAKAAVGPIVRDSVGDDVSSLTNVGLCVIGGLVEGIQEGACVCPVNVSVAVTAGTVVGDPVGALWHSQGSRINPVRIVQNWGAINPS